ncbi:MAG: hypothetical protein M1816_000318 [Peltula sp. TS41687]|nr:MAG: hypothetical protein M1816_000318 [Peltula sp. TS41687]
MGASDSKLVFKKSIFRLSEDAQIQVDDPFWTAFWELPENTEDISTLFSPSDIRRTRDQSLGNLETLILAVTTRLFTLRDHASFPDSDVAPENHALNCIRILTRILPFLYEADHLEDWENKFFWSGRKKHLKRRTTGESEVLFDESRPDQEALPETSRDDSQEAGPLAEELIDTLVDMLFYAGFTLPRNQDAKNKVTYAIWQSGVGCHTSIATSKELENNRCEVLKLLLTLASKSMFMPASGCSADASLAYNADDLDILPVQGTLKYNPASWRVPYDHVVFKDSRQILVNQSLQFLLALILYPPPEKSAVWNSKNYYRHYLGRLHRSQDFQFLVDGMTRVLKQPLQAYSTYLPGSQKSISWAPEMIMLFWEMLQCNKHFRSFIIDTDRAHDFLILILFYALEQREDSSRHGVVRMCVFALQTLSTEPKFGKRLNKKFEGQSSLPPSIRLEGFHGTYADYLIISIYNLFASSQGSLQAIHPAMLAIINNVAAYLEHISATASTKLMQLFALMSSPSFLLANETNHKLLTALLEAINSIIEHQFSSNATFVLAILRSRKRFEDLRNFTLESAQEDLQRQRRRKETQSTEHKGSSPARASSGSVRHSPIATQPRTSLQNVPEESETFAIGEDDDSEDDEAKPRPTNVSNTHQSSRATSVSSPIEDAVPLQLRGMSEKARGKLPAGAPTFSRQNSTTSLNHSATAMATSEGNFIPSEYWMESWLPELPLHTILTLIQELSPQLPSRAGSGQSDSSSDLQYIKQAEIRGIEPSPVRVHLFEWSPYALGWYESLLWGFIFASEIHISKGSVGIWNGTAIKLFKVQEVAASGPSLLAPRGAVDAVGSNLVQRIGSLNFRGSSSGGSGPRDDTRRESGGG